MTLERLLNIPSDHEDLKRYLNASEDNKALSQRLEVENVRYDKAIEYLLGNRPDKTISRKVSNAFQAGMPGVLSRSELIKIVNLGQWRLRIGKRILHLEVRSKSPSYQTLLMAGFS